MNDVERFIEQTAPDLVNHPPHYKNHPARCECGQGVECIQITEHMNFNLGNAVKYIWRADERGDPLENLRKAEWYVKREIERRQKAVRRYVHADDCANHFDDGKCSCLTGR